MGTTPTNSHPLELEKSRPISRIQYPFISKSSSFRGLPQELITEILLRVPVKSLLKFKCVSKPWLSLISSPNFIKHHFSKACVEGECLNHQVLFTIVDPAPGMKQCSLYSALHDGEPCSRVFDVERPVDDPDQLVRVVGIVNGLVCLAIGPDDHFHLSIWNPVLRKYKQLPGTDENLGRFTRVNYGFGYDESNDDYKVFSLKTVYFYGDTSEAEVGVYSLRGDSWKRIEDLKDFISLHEDGIYANGKMYWSAFDRGDLIQNKKIVRHDMLTEKYEELQQPDYVAGYFELKLCVLGGLPCVLFDYYGTKADLWVIGNHGGEESWSKLLSIPYDDGYLSMPYSYQQVVCILSSGEIVLAKEFGFLVYSTKDRQSRKIELDVGGSSSPSKVDTYVESLFWPFG